MIALLEKAKVATLLKDDNDAMKVC